MARGQWMRRYARWHIWLGWVVGLPVLMWTVTGLFMVARPIDEVRGMPGAAKGAAWIADAERYKKAMDALEVIETAATPQQAWNGAEWTASIPLAAQRLNSPSVMPVVT